MSNSLSLLEVIIFRRTNLSSISTEELRSKENIFRAVFLCLLFAVLLSGCSVNGTPASLQTFLNNLSRTYSSLWRLVTAWAYITGVAFGAMAIFQLKTYGEMRTMMSGQGNIFKPLTFLLVSAALMWLPSTFKTLMMSTFGTPNSTPLSYSTLSSVGIGGYTLAITPALIGLMKLVGLIAFVRGWIILAHISEQGQHASFGKAATHILGGLLLINIVAAGNILSNLVSVG